MNNRWRGYFITFIIVFAGTFIFRYFSNEKEVIFIEKNINDLYSVKIPDYLKDTVSLNEFASYQGINTEKHSYLIIIDELKTGRYSLKQYNMFVENSFKTKFDEYEILDKKELNINGFSAIQYNIKATKNEEVVYSFCTVIKGTIDFYQIISWTSLGNRKTFFKDVEKAVNSFNEL